MSQRHLIWIVGIVASGIALVSRLAGAFSGWDAHLFLWLGLVNLRNALPLTVEIGCILLFAFGVIFVELGVTSGKARLGLLLAALLQPISATAVGALLNYPVSPFSWLTAILIPVLAAYAYRFSNRGQKERLLRQVFGAHVSALTLEKLARDPELFHPKKTQATVLNARFTGEKIDELESITQHFRELGAWVELQAGDRVVAIWNAPLPIDSAAQIATAATLELGKNWQVGIATGDLNCELSAANIWQMRGPSFERASALCQANASFDSRILIDLKTSDAVAEMIVVRPVDLFTDPGADFGREIFEPLALSRFASAEVVAERDEFWNAVILFRQKRFTEALAAFRKSGNDPVVQRYLKRLENLNSPS